MWSPELKIWVCHCLSCQISDLRNQVYLENGLDLLPGEGQVVGRQIRKPLDKMEHGGEPGPEAELGGGAAVQDKLQVASTIAHSHSPGQSFQCVSCRLQDNCQEVSEQASQVCDTRRGD